jgi:hypothetical protein
LAGQNEELRVGGEDLGDGVLESPTGLDAPLDLLDPLFGDAFDVSFSPEAVAQQPAGVSFVGSAVAGRLSALGVVEDDGTGESIDRQLDGPDLIELLFVESGGVGALGISYHLVASMIQV